MAGPTGGYLLGFLAAAGLCGWLAERGWDRRTVPALGAMLLGHSVIFALGVAWLSLIVGFEQAVASGLAPFPLGPVVKVALAAAVPRPAWPGPARPRA